MTNLPKLPRRHLPRGGRNVGLSAIATEVLDHYIRVLRAEDLFPYQLTRSNVVEWLVHQALGGKLEDFVPRTAGPGRKPVLSLSESQKHLRPGFVLKQGESHQARVDCARRQLESIAREVEQELEEG